MFEYGKVQEVGGKESLRDVDEGGRDRHFTISVLHSIALTSSLTISYLFLH